MTGKEALEILWMNKEQSTKNALYLIGDMPALYSQCKDNMRVHGNGFIQIDIQPHLRLHIWDDAIPCQAISTPIHDHRFGFESLVLMGTLINIDYTAQETNILFACPPKDDYPSSSGLHRMYTPVSAEGEDTKLVLYGENLWLMENTGGASYSEGKEYSFEAREFHETQHEGLTATLMRKNIEYPRHQVRVACRSGLKPDNDFNRYMIDMKKMWELVELVSQQVRSVT